MFSSSAIFILPTCSAFSLSPFLIFLQVSVHLCVNFLDDKASSRVLVWGLSTSWKRLQASASQQASPKVSTSFILILQLVYERSVYNWRAPYVSEDPFQSLEVHNFGVIPISNPYFIVQIITCLVSLEICLVLFLHLQNDFNPYTESFNQRLGPMFAPASCIVFVVKDVKGCHFYCLWRKLFLSIKSFFI